MALNAVVQGMNSTVAPSSAEEEAFYNKLLGLAGAVVSGKHAHFKLPPAAVEQLKASLASLHAPAPSAQQVAASTLANGVAYSANASTTNTQQYPTPGAPSLPGLHTSHTPFVNGAPPSLTKATSSGLDPIFLEKSAVLIKAENQHKRQHIERDLQAQVAQGKRPGRDEGAEAPSLDMGSILAAAAAREPHVSGLKYSGRVDSEASSFDTNDYYSSQVQSDWSSPQSASKGSDRAAGALPADFESLEGPNAQSYAQTSASGKQPAVARDDPITIHAYSAQLRNAYEIVDDDEDEEYTPPDVPAFTGFEEDGGMEEGQIGSDDDDDDYEPGEVTMDSNVPTPSRPSRQVQRYSPKVIRNHLTHIAAPQPSRVSPLAVVKGPNLGGELELVNGRPEVVNHKTNNRHNPNASRASTASPQNGVGISSKKRRNKKRKRDLEQQQPAGGRAKKKRDRHAAPQSPAYQEPRIKDEPVSPPPFAGMPDVQPYAQRPAQYRPAEVDLVSPRHIPLPPSPYVPDPRSSGLRYEYAQPASPAVVRVASPAAFRPVQRDNHDLRRVASIHYAQRLPSPTRSALSPPPQRTVSMTYGDPRMPQAPVEVRYQDAARADYHDPYAARPHSPAVVAAPPPTRIVVDQYGNQYYAAEADPAPAPPPPAYRASAAPIDRRPGPPETGYERAPSRAAPSYAPPAYERVDARLGPPSKRRAVEEPNVQYVDANGFPLPTPQYHRPEVRYMEAPTSPMYQQPPQPRYDMAPPPAPSAREQTSPVYAEPSSSGYPSTRSYSVRPEVPAAPQYARHASVAPQQYARQASVAPPQFARSDAPPAPPARAMSVMPGYEQPRAYAQAPQPVRYVDQYGREIVYQTDSRPPAPPEYMYQ
ncbi:hypothetical protein CERZMDRAFT_105943 [Cercospora zeae-maydis SCOH1-5]|uniref:Uncharacterized protein n=1 Tax=Cercospora zeae-maydis SCOH1-5 TaxID=717836 RepID=A0A6A6FIX8_9PEZI|nr:hypothetical protein CERZMDRAFT_105943 [Cercospora zeae-maydis SCOH1-5]